MLRRPIARAPLLAASVLTALLIGDLAAPAWADTAPPAQTSPAIAEPEPDHTDARGEHTADADDNPSSPPQDATSATENPPSTEPGESPTALSPTPRGMNDCGSDNATWGYTVSCPAKLFIPTTGTPNLVFRYSTGSLNDGRNVGDITVVAACIDIDTKVGVYAGSAAVLNGPGGTGWQPNTIVPVTIAPSALNATKGRVDCVFQVKFGRYKNASNYWYDDFVRIDNGEYSLATPSGVIDRGAGKELSFGFNTPVPDARGPEWLTLIDAMGLGNSGGTQNLNSIEWPASRDWTATLDTPSGASYAVGVGSLKKGNTTVTGSLPASYLQLPGTYTLTLTLDGFNSIGGTFTLTTGPVPEIVSPTSGSACLAGADMPLIVKNVGDATGSLWYTIDGRNSDSVDYLRPGETGTATLNLAAGSHTISIHNTWNEWATAVTVNCYDAIIISSPRDGATVGASGVTFRGTADENAGELNVSVDGGAPTKVVNSGNWSVLLRLPVGVHVVTVTYADHGDLPGVQTSVSALAPATVTEVRPAAAAVGQKVEVTLVGENLSGITRVALEDLEDYDASALSTVIGSTSDTEVVVSFTASRVGRFEFVVVAPNGTAGDRATFEVFPAVELSGLSPAVGPITGGVRVTVSGQGLADVSEVRFGGVAGTSLLTTSSGNWVSVVVPAAAAAGAVDVVAVSPVGESVLAGAYTYAAVPVFTRPLVGVRQGSAPLIAGTAHPGQAVRLVDTSVRDELGAPVLIGEATADEAGAWSIRASAQSSGVHVYVVTDGLGQSAEREVVISERVRFTSPEAGAVVPQRPAITGTAHPGAQLTVYDGVDGPALGTATASVDGVWEITVTDRLAVGGHALVAIDDINISATRDVTVVSTPGARVTITGRLVRISR